MGNTIEVFVEIFDNESYFAKGEKHITDIISKDEAGALDIFSIVNSPIESS